jgi:predicted permease
MFSNTGNYGLSAIMLAFGQEALARGSIYFVVSAVMMYTVGVFLASAGTRSTVDALKSVLKVPAVWGAMLAVLVLATGWRPPRPIMIGTQALSDAAIPVMMLVLGMQFERARRPERPGLVALASLLTLVVQPLLAFGLADFIGLTGTARQASILEASMPAAIVTTILALEYDAAPAFVTSVVFITTLLSPLSVTVIIALLK